MTLKLYTDFDELQFELKKCFRQPQSKEDADDLADRLQSFYHWRGGLLIVLHKFGSFINEKNNNINLFVGVNSKMILKPSKTFAFSGPLSSTSSFHVAKSFATAKGMVLEITSQFPRANYCNAFDASLISDYPEEHEWLIGFMYARLLEVTTNKLTEQMINSFTEMSKFVPISSFMREVFFALHLFKEQVFSMSDHLCHILVQFLKVHRGECCNNEIQQKYEKHNDEKWNPNSLCKPLCAAAGHEKGMNEWKLRTEKAKTLISIEQKEDIERANKLVPILWKKFNEFRMNPNGRQCVKFGVISKNLQSFFMQPSDENDIETGKEKWKLSFEEICSVYPNVKELHFLNRYGLDNAILYSLLKQIQRGNENKIQKVVFFYYDYKEADANGMPLNKSNFNDPSNLRTDLIKQLEERSWKIKYGKNGTTGYKIRIYAENRK